MSDRLHGFCGSGKDGSTKLPIDSFGWSFPAFALFFLVLFLFMAIYPALSRGVSVYDLIHDTPLTRKKYRMEILGFSTEMTPVKGFETDGEMAEDIWLARQRFIELGETEKADSQIEELIKWRLDRGRRNLVSYAVLLIREAFTFLENNQRDRAATLIGYAIRIAPDYPPVYLAQGFLSLKIEPFGLPALIKGVYLAGKATLNNAYHLLNFSGILIVFYVFIIVLFAAFWSIAVLVRHAVCVLHDLEEFAGRRFNRAHRRLLAFFGLLAPFVLFPSPAWAVALVILLTWAYQSFKERLVSLSTVLLILLLPFCAWLVTTIVLFVNDDLTVALMAVRNGSEKKEQVLVLQAYLQKNPLDHDVSFALAQHYWRLESFEKAEELYRRILEKSETLLYEANMNFGNVLTAREKFEKAAEAYSKAKAINPASAASYYNLAQVRNLQFRFGEGEQELKKAMALDKVFVSNMTARAGDKPMTYLHTERLPLGVFYGRITDFGRSKRIQIAGMDLWRLSLTGFQAAYYPPFIIFIVILGMINGMRLKKRGLAKRCIKCGRPYCPMCFLGADKMNICPQCQHIFFVKEGVESSMRVEKMIEVNAYHRGRIRLGFYMSLLMSGTGQIYLGYPFLGVLMTLFFLIPMVLLVGPYGPLVNVNCLFFPWNTFFMTLVLVLLILFYLANLISIIYLGRRAS